MTTKMSIAVITHTVLDSPTLVSACGFDRDDEAGALEYINNALKAWIKTNKEIAAQHINGWFELDADSDVTFAYLNDHQMFVSANQGESVIYFAIDAATKEELFKTEG